MEKLLLLQGRWEQLAETAKFDSKKLAQLCEVSTRQLQRHFHRQFQISPQHWLNQRRLLLARERLLAGEPVKKTAHDLGFKHASHFCRKFKLQYHMTPTQFTLSQIDNTNSI